MTVSKGSGTAVRIQTMDLVAWAEQAAAVQSAALGPVSPDRPDIYVRHASYPGLRSFAVFDGDLLVGFTYGTRCLPGQWWHDQIDPALRAAGQGGWLTDAYSVTELHVLPEWQGRGIGRGLLTTLLRGVPQATAVLSTYDTESRARALYRSVGFVDLVTGFCFSGQRQPYALMGARLPLAD